MNSIDHKRTRVELCGGLSVEIEGRRLEALIRGRQERLLFSYLVLNRERPVRREELIEALWPDRPPASPGSALNTLVSRLRKAIGEGVVCGRSELTLELSADAWVDIECAFAAIGRAEAALERSGWQEAISAAEVAVSVVEQGFLPEVEASWVEDERRRLEEVRLRAFECLAACGLGLGGSQLSTTERAARRLIEASPYRETGYGYLMQALADRGRVAEALQVFDDVRRLLHAELGTAPSAGLRSLHQRLLGEPRFELGPSVRDAPLAVGPAVTTALFTDLVYGTEVAPGLVGELRIAHLRLLSGAVAAHGGQLVGEAGGGSIAEFGRARNALACAVEVQQAVERHNRRHPLRELLVRVALHCGDPVRADEEQMSISQVARRLCGRAGPGRILASSALRTLAAPEQRLRDAGALALPGNAHPLGVLEVMWEPAPQPLFALPSAFSATDSENYVGREEYLGRLWRLYEQASTTGVRVAFVRGDPGIGKTRLATELALLAHADGAVVLYGRCDEEPLLPHQPFAEALSHYVSACPLSELVGQVTPSSGELRRLVPELAERLADLAQPLRGDPEGARYRLFESATALLCRASASSPRWHSRRGCCSPHGPTATTGLNDSCPVGKGGLRKQNGDRPASRHEQAAQESGPTVR